MWIDELTDNEREVLRAAECEGSYEAPFGFSYEIAIYNYARISETSSRGALASLVKKGILHHDRFREDGMLWNYYSVPDKQKIKELRDYFGRG